MSSNFFYKAGYGGQCRWDVPISNETILTLFYQRIRLIEVVRDLWKSLQLGLPRPGCPDLRPNGF